MNSIKQTIVVSIDGQELGLWSDETQSYRKRYRASTARNGPGEIENSGCTPRGQLVVEEKIGDGCALGTVFIGRKPVDPLDVEDKSRMGITTRILRLGGRQLGFNGGDGRDTFNRYIYIHGVPYPAPIPVNNSGGCIGLSNEDMLDLYNQVEAGTPVVVYERPLPECYVHSHETTESEIVKHFPAPAVANWFMGATKQEALVAYIAAKGSTVVEMMANEPEALSQLQEIFAYEQEARKNRGAEGDAS